MEAEKKIKKINFFEFLNFKKRTLPSRAHEFESCQIALDSISGSQFAHVESSLVDVE